MNECVTIPPTKDQVSLTMFFFLYNIYIFSFFIKALKQMKRSISRNSLLIHTCTKCIMHMYVHPKCVFCVFMSVFETNSHVVYFFCCERSTKVRLYQFSKVFFFIFLSYFQTGKKRTIAFFVNMNKTHVAAALLSADLFFSSIQFYTNALFNEIKYSLIQLLTIESNYLFVRLKKCLFKNKNERSKKNIEIYEI